MGLTKWLDEMACRLYILFYGKEKPEKKEVNIEDIKKEFNSHYKLNQYISD